MERAQPTPVAACADFRLNEWRIQPSLGRVSGAEGAVRVRPLLMELLVLLARNPGRLVSKEEIVRSIWGRQFLSESALTRLMTELRQVLQDDAENPRFIETVPKRGYRLIAPVISESEPVAAAGRLSVAVLPFVDMAREKDQEYLCEGLSEELTNALTRLPGLRVIARTSAFAFKGKAVDVREIGRQLGVNAVIEGSVQHSAGRLRVTVQVIDAADGGHLWSDHFDRPAGDIFAIEDEIAQAVAGGLRVKLVAPEQSGYLRRHSRDSKAHDLYLYGRFLWGKRTPDAVARAVECFRDALERDGTYALAHAALSECHATAGFLGFDAPWEAYPSARTSALKALASDPTLAEAHAVLGFVKGTYEWEWIEAENCFRRAIELGPSYAQARLWHSSVLAAAGRTGDAIAEIERGWDLDPLSPVMEASLSYILLEGRQYEAAAERCRNALEREPDHVLANFHLGRTLAAMGRCMEAVPHMERAATGFPVAMGLLGAMWAELGRPDKAEEILREMHRMSQERYVGPFAFVTISGKLYGAEAALDWLGKAFDVHEGLVCLAGVDPSMDWLRPAPRFQALLGRLRIPSAPGSLRLPRT